MRSLFKPPYKELKISLISLAYYLCIYVPAKVYQNDYLNPYTMTFKNPKTLQMFNIIVLYHYIMSLLLVVVVITFTFIFFSLFRGYFLFLAKPYYPTQYKTIAEVFQKSTPLTFLPAIWDYFTYLMLVERDKEYINFIHDIRYMVPKDRANTHAPTLEFLWVLFPTLILIAIAYPSILVLYYNEMYVKPLYTISVIGNQWYWTYEYNDFNLSTIFKRHVTHDNARLIKALELSAIGVTEYMNRTDILNEMHEKDKLIIKKLPLRYTVDCNLLIAKNPKFLRLLTTDKCLVLPAKVPIRLLVTSNDVIHSWAVPCYGVKMDAIPGRLNQIILNIPLAGTSWGQCSELCGVNHAYMPIEVKVIHHADFLYFMRLKITHILLPHLNTYYKNRIKVIKYFVLKFKALHDANPEGFSFSEFYEAGRFDRLLNSKTELYALRGTHQVEKTDVNSLTGGHPRLKNSMSSLTNNKTGSYIQNTSSTEDGDKLHRVKSSSEKQYRNI